MSVPKDLPPLLRGRGVAFRGKSVGGQWRDRRESGGYWVGIEEGVKVGFGTAIPNSFPTPPIGPYPSMLENMEGLSRYKQCSVGAPTILRPSYRSTNIEELRSRGGGRDCICTACLCIWFSYHVLPTDGSIEALSPACVDSAELA